MGFLSSATALESLVLLTDETLDLDSNTSFLVTASGANRSLTLPVIAKRFWLAGGNVIVVNVGDTYAVEIRQPDNTLLDTLQPDDYGRYYGANTKWYIGDSTAVSSVPYEYAVAFGDISGATTIRKFGRNLDLDSGVEEDIWAGGGTRVYLSSAETMDIASTSADDDGDPAGTGAQTVTIEGLDSAFAEISETVTLNGTSAVTTSNSYLRVHRVYCGSVGSGGVNAGDITVDPTSSGSGSRQAFIDTGEGQTQLTHYTIPAGKTGYLIGGQASIFAVSGASTRACRIQMWCRNNASSSWRAIKEVGLALHGTSVISDINFTIPEVFNAQTDLRFTGLADVNNTGAYVQYNLLLVDN